MRSGGGAAWYENPLRARALADIDEIYNYLRMRSPSGALNVLQAIFAGIRRIAEMPYAFQATSDPEIRVLILQRNRYKVFYTILVTDTVEILHVRHTSRKPWQLSR
jgi:toxin ParE1/3/4